MNEFSEKQFLEWYDRYVGKIYRYIYFRVGAAETAQDLTSEVFLKSWQYLNSRGVNNPRAFFYQVARNLITDFYRKKDSLPISLEEIADKTFSDKISDKNEFERKTGVSLEMETVKRALKKLNGDYQEIIIWHYLDELEIKEIAEILDKREGTVRTLLSRALNELREALKNRPV